MIGNNKSNDITNMQTIFNNNIAMNQNFYNNMQAMRNNPYVNSYQQTMNNFQSNNLNNINMNNMQNILSLINFPVLVPYHSQHPLINCYVTGRAKPFGNWFCDSCKASYTYNIPSFYCTACDFDLCQKCFLSLGAYQIVIHNYLKSVINPNEKFRNESYIDIKIHNHPMVKIQREKTHFVLNLKCNRCIKDLQKNEQFYYCSLCNFCLCTNCYEKNSQKNSTKIAENTDYLSGDQMDPK